MASTLTCSGKHVSLKFFQVVLTLFYGQFMSNGIFDNFILTIPELSENASWYNIVKVLLGIVIFATSIFSLIVVWMKYFRLIFLSGIILLFVHVTTIVITTVVLTLDYDKRSKSDMGKLVAEVIVEAIFQLIGIIATFFMASRREYVPPDRTLDSELKEKIKIKSTNLRSRSKSQVNKEDYDYNEVNQDDEANWQQDQTNYDEEYHVTDLDPQHLNQTHQMHQQQVLQQSSSQVNNHKSNRLAKPPRAEVVDLDF